MKNYKILAEFVKDVSVETKDIQTYLFVKDYITKYQLTIDITSQPTNIFKDVLKCINAGCYSESKECFELFGADLMIDEDFVVKLIEVNTIMKFEDKEDNEKKSYFELVYLTIVKLDDNVKEKKEIEKILLCEVQKDIQPKLEKSFTDLIVNSGFNNITVKNIDFDKLFNSRSN